jgi:hypothetical protein
LNVTFANPVNVVDGSPADVPASGQASDHPEKIVLGDPNALLSIEALEEHFGPLLQRDRAIG